MVLFADNKVYFCRPAGLLSRSSAFKPPLMTRNLIIASIIILMASCSSTKPINSSVKNKPSTKPVSVNKPADNKKNDIKFLDEITANPNLAANIPDAKTEQKETAETLNKTKFSTNTPAKDVSALKIKYAQLLGKEPDQINNVELLRSVDEWYGTKYKMGGTSKSGIDCSAFVQSVYLSAFGIAVPRTAFEQFKAAYHISATEMKEGDLVFFNTTGGVSHVGIYMGNNKFAHASSARGVTVSDLFDPYYLKRFLGIGRIDKNLGTR
jgi:cell wall-associated NlpC family hydrolase